MRRSYAKTPKGKLYCIEWPEWHVECAAEGCSEDLLVSPLGESTTLREAEKKALTDATKGWQKCGDFWFCPAHAKIPAGRQL